jgi:hypothetical protein
MQGVIPKSTKDLKKLPHNIYSIADTETGNDGPNGSLLLHKIISCVNELKTRSGRQIKEKMEWDEN